MKRLYFRALMQWVELEDHIAEAIEGDRSRIRNKEQQHGRCFISARRRYLCDGDCDDCEFHRQGGYVVDTRGCRECELPTDRRGRSPKCRNCEFCRFVSELATLDEPIGEGNEDAFVDTLVSKESGPEELAIERVTMDAYCQSADRLVTDGGVLVSRLGLGDTISEIARDLEKDQRTLDSRKRTLKRKMNLTDRRRP